ncbi:hypothetical protein Godav_026288 [Gossypium davidsonii]|uniref:RING-type domain-containing protein n=1 Tax=Gossypium davidsonii TaxID=34287 RepID=A0A7J8RTY6_GOSDV|nr:hypothetical protein [Gossypium davidsonii]
MSYSGLMMLPKSYFDIFLVILLVPILNLLVYLHNSFSTSISYLGLPYFIEPDITVDADHVSSSSSPATRRCNIPLSALLLRELLPVVKFSDLVDPPDSCSVCFKDFETKDEIWRLANCRHIFHRSCLNRWMGYDQKTCPLCRLSLVPHDKEEMYNERLWWLLKKKSFVLSYGGSMVLPKPYFENRNSSCNLHDSIFTTFFYLGLPYFIEPDITEDADHVFPLLQPPRAAAIPHLGSLVTSTITRREVFQPRQSSK